jgi:uncharacterized protein
MGSVMMNASSETADHEIRDNMQIDWDVPIEMDDGLVLRADVFRPVAAGRYPVILSYGPYGKGLAFQEGYKTAWDLMIARYPDTAANSTNKYQNWEVADPEKWVPDGYVCVRVDSRGAGRSPGYIDHNSPRETKDLHDCIEWAATQPWSSGKVGLTGISYYASNQWRAAGLHPPHLAAICVWEGWSDPYRDAIRHGGILCTFRKNWQDMQVKTVQHGRGERGSKSRVTGELVCGPETLSEHELTANRADMWNDLLLHRFDDEYFRSRSAILADIVVPLLSAGNWGGQGLHLRGNVEGYLGASSKQKWLEMHGGEHWTGFYTDYGVGLQKRFFGHFLKGEDTGWEKEPALRLQIRHPGGKFVERHESEWPLARTQWTKFYLDPVNRSLVTAPVAGDGTIEFEAMGEGVTFMMPALEHEIEITGPCAAKLFVSSSTRDADLFLVLRVFEPNGQEVTFQGALDPHTPAAQGWLRASHRKLDPKRSTPYRPYHSHDELWPLDPGQVVELDVEIWPTSIVVPKGYRVGLSVLGRDYEHAGAAATLSNMKNPMKGCGPFVHDDPHDRPPTLFAGHTTLHCGPTQHAHVLLPLIPRT